MLLVTYLIAKSISDLNLLVLSAISLSILKLNLLKMSDYSLTTFGESGELTQVRHAMTAVGNGETIVGIRAKNGIVIAAEKKLPSILIDESSIHKIDKLSDYMGVSYSGIGPDFQAVLLKARKDVQQYHKIYMDRINPFALCKQVADLFQEYT